MPSVDHHAAWLVWEQVLLLVSVQTTSRSLKLDQLQLTNVDMGHKVVGGARVVLICCILPPHTPPTLGLLVLMVVVVVWEWWGGVRQCETKSL